MKLFQEENVIFCLRNWSPSHIYFFHLGGTRIRESATADKPGQNFETEKADRVVGAHLVDGGEQLSKVLLSAQNIIKFSRIIFG